MMKRKNQKPKFSIRMWHWTMAEENLLHASAEHVRIFALLIEEASK